jgi:hypothetical protein
MESGEARVPMSEADEIARRAGQELRDQLTPLYYSNFERAHRSAERASSQGIKILATAHAGLGVILAAWLQRIFEGAPAGHLTALAGYLVTALFPVMLGLLSVGIVCFLDVRAAQYQTDSSLKQLNRVLTASRLRTSARSAEEQSHIDTLGTEAGALDKRAQRWNRWSEGIGLAGWALLVISLAILGVGVAGMVYRC